MERLWDKKRILRLNQADESVVEQWLADYLDIIYTWLYYQVGADAAITVELTSGTFERAVRELQHFNPDLESMQQWLREQAKPVLEQGLAMRQMQPQRPWAWSHLPDGILEGLAQLRSEPLSDHVTNNPFVRELVQASLAEMEAANRDLMRRRYNLLQTPEQIAGETGSTTSDVDDRLYRSRHFFRRTFVQLLVSVNPNFSESSAPGSLELLDTNLEKLLSSTNMVQTVSPKDRAHIREIVLAAARQTPPLKTGNGNTKVTFAIAAGIMILALPLLGAIVWYSHLSPTPRPAAPIPPAPQPQPQPQDIEKNPTPAEIAQAEEQIDEEELRRVLELGQKGDVAGLLEVLRNGRYTSQRTAALFLGELGDEGAIGLLQEAEAKWYPDGPADNPFAQAIMQIEERLLAESDAVIEEPAEPTPADVNEPVVADANEEPEPKPVPEPAISGTVTDFSGRPLADARVTLSENPLYSNVSNSSALDQATTNDQGQYLFQTAPAGAFFIDCHAAMNGPSISRSIWHGIQTHCRIDFGGSPSIVGMLEDPVEGVSGQILYLTDTLDPTDAAFRAESVTDADGQFSFAGVEPGSYFLLNASDMNRIVRIDTLDVAREDIQNLSVSRRQAAVTVEIEMTETDLPATAVVVTYGPEVSEDLARYALTQQDNGTWSSDSIPYGSYTLMVRFENGMRLQQPLELNSDRTVAVSVPQGSALLTGTFSNPSFYTFVLSGSDQHVQFDLSADTAGVYTIDEIPPDTYTLTAAVNNLRLEFMDIDLQDEQELVLDIDAGQLLSDYSPLYVAVADARGAMLSNAQVWVTGAGEVVTTQSTGRGAFLALPPGEYTLYAALPGYSTAEQVIQVQSMPLETGPNPGNTIGLQLQSP